MSACSKFKPLKYQKKQGEADSLLEKGPSTIKLKPLGR